MPSENEIKQITELHDLGYSQGQIAKEMGKGKTTINRWLQGLGLLNGTEPERSGTKKATDAKRTYDRERRLALNDLWFEKHEKMLLEAEDSKTLRELATPYGVAMDKRSNLEPQDTEQKARADSGFMKGYHVKAEEFYATQSPPD